MPDLPKSFTVGSFHSDVNKTALYAFFVLLCLFVLPSGLYAACPACAPGSAPYWPECANYLPTVWPADNLWAPYTSQGSTIDDPRTNDPSNGGARPQNYVNVSSGCPDMTKPSVYFYYDSAAQMFFYRWRVEQIPVNYATGPAPGSYQAVSPWWSGLWTVFFDINGDGFRDYAMFLDGSSGIPSAPVDIIQTIYSNSLNNHIDPHLPGISGIATNPTAFVDRDAVTCTSTSTILNFHNIITPDTSWPNGSIETVWDYGTTRAVDITYSDTSPCGSTNSKEYFVDYQVPIAMLGGSVPFDCSAPAALLFATANSITNPFQKDLALGNVNFVATPDQCAPFGDMVILCPVGGGPPQIIPQPVIDWVTAKGCGPTTLTASVRSALQPPCATTLTSVQFYYYYDANNDGQPNDAGSSWTLIGSGSNSSSSSPAIWTYTWDSSGIHKGQYLIGVKATDGSGHTTFSYLTAAQAAPNYANPSPKPGVVYGIFNNNCGKAATVTKSVTPAYDLVTRPFRFTITVTNYDTNPLTLNSISDILPPTFSYNSSPIESGSLLGSITSRPSNGATGTIQWTLGSGVTINPGNSADLSFTANAGSVTGTYTNVTTASTVISGQPTTLTSNPVDVGVGSPRLTIQKMVSKYFANAGDTLVYTMTYSNDSPVDVHNTVITDPLPLGFTYTSISNGGTYDPATRTVTWNIGTLGSLEGPYTVTVTGTVDTNPAPAKLVNVAYIDSDETLPISSGVDVTVYINTPLLIQKTATPLTFSPGSQVAFTIQYRNNGSTAQDNVVITDPIPTGFTFVSAAAGTNCPAGVNTSGTVTWTFPLGPLNPLPAGTVGTCNLVLQANNPFTGSSTTTNTAGITATGLSPVYSSATVTKYSTSCTSPTTYYFHAQTANVGATNTLTSVPAVGGGTVNIGGTQSIANTTAPSSGGDPFITSPQTSSSGGTLPFAQFYLDPPVTNGESFSGSVTVNYWAQKKAGNPTIDVELWDYDPATGAATNLGYQTGGGAGGSIQNYTMTFTPTGPVTQGHRLLFVFYINGNGSSIYFHYDSTTYSSYASACMTPIQLEIQKGENKLAVSAAGDTLTYTITFANSGLVNTTGTQIIDTLDPNTSFASATLNGSAITPTCVGQVCTFNVKTQSTVIGTDGITNYSCILNHTSAAANRPTTGGSWSTYWVQGGTGGSTWTTATAYSSGQSGVVQAGLSGVLIINVNVNAIPAGTFQLTNVAAIKSDQTQPVSVSVPARVITNPYLTVIKSADKTRLIPGDTVTFTLAVLSSGMSQANNVVLTDNLSSTIDDTYFTYVAGSASNGGTYDSGSKTITWNLGDMASGAILTRSFQMIVASTSPPVPQGVTEKSNAASAVDQSATYTSNTVIVSISPNANLQITKSVSDVNSNSPAKPGDILEYTINLGNVGGSDALNVMVSDPIPSNTTYKSGTLIYQGSSRTDISGDDNAYFDALNNRVIFDVGTLARAASVTMKFRVAIASALPNGTTTITNTATASASNTASKQATASIDASSAPVLSLLKSGPSAMAYPLTTVPSQQNGVTTFTVASAQFIEVGDVIYISNNAATVTVTAVNKSANTVTVNQTVSPQNNANIFGTFNYVLNYQNAGTSDATSAVVSDALPANMLYVSASPTPTSAPAPGANGTVTWNLGTVPVGGYGRLTVRVRPSAAGTYLNNGTMSSTEIPSFNSNIVQTVVGGVTLTKYSENRVNNPTLIRNITIPNNGGTTAAYVITLTNQTATAASNIVVTDTLPVGFTYAGPSTYGGGTCTGAPTAGSNTLNWTNCSIGGFIGAQLTITFPVNIAATVGAGTYQNPVSASSATLTILPFDELNTTDDDVTITVPNDLAVTKTVQSVTTPECRAGACSVTFLITVRNVGSNNETNVQITDILPAGLTYSSNIPSQGTFNSGTGVWTVGNVNVGAAATLQLTANVTTSSTIVNCASLTASTQADTNSANNTSCASLVPTQVVLSSFKAIDDNGRMMIEWTTASENGTAGFYLFRRDDVTGTYQRINSRLLPGLLTARQGGTYTLIDNGADVSQRYTYVLVEVEGRGSKLAYGPFSVRAGEDTTQRLQISDSIDPLLLFADKKKSLRRGSAVIKSYSSDGSDIFAIGNIQNETVGLDNYSGYTRKAREKSATGNASLATIGNRRQAAVSVSAIKVGSSIRIVVSEEGLYFFDTARIAALLGLQEKAARQLVKSRGFVLSNQGKNVDYMPASDYSGLFFYGQTIDSIYTKDNVYWLKRGGGSFMDSVRGQGPQPSSVSGTFTETRHFEEDKIDIPGFTSDAADDYWFWDYVNSGDPDMGSKTFSFTISGVADSSVPATLVVRLKGVADTSANLAHHAVIYLNKTKIGEDLWGGNEEHEIVLSFDQGLLSEGDNSLEITGILIDGVDYSLVFVNSFDVAYERSYLASGNRLFCRGDNNAVVTVNGFTRADISLFDVSSPLEPRVIMAKTIGGTSGNFSVSFSPSSPDATYLALSGDAVLSAGDVSADTGSGLKTRTNRVDYVVITVPELKGTASRLAAYRGSKGLRTMVVELRDIMDEFNNGIYSPLAIKAFLSYAYKSWIKPPRYVVLAGNGSYDYKKNYGYTDNLVPAMMVSTPHGISPSDNFYADVDNNGVPEIIVGRLPAKTAEELQDMIDKIISYENGSGGAWERKALLLADYPEAGANFSQESDEVASLLPLSYAKERIYLSEHSFGEARGLVMEGINNGAAFLNFIGHAGVDRLTQDGLITSDDVGAMTNAGALPVVTAMTCDVGFFAIPGYDSLAEELVLKQKGGAVAVWAPSGLAIDSQSVVLDKEFYRRAFNSASGQVLGDLILNALKSYSAKGYDPSILGIYTLLGDPALRLRGIRVQ